MRSTPRWGKRQQKSEEIARVELSRPHPDVPEQKSVYDVEPDVDRSQDPFRHLMVHSRYLGTAS
jgi:hypothetical protein